MSSALVRQALEFVDPEEHGRKRNKRRPGQQSGTGQDNFNPYKRKRPVKSEPLKDTAEENIKKLLALSTPIVDNKIADKIVERAIKGKPLADKETVKKDDGKSILFPNESFKDFENELFCS